MTLKKHYCSTVVLVTQEKPRRILLIHHKKMEAWLPPGGHQEENEDPIQAAIRETQEETGIDITAFFPNPVRLDENAQMLPVPNYLLEEKIPAHGTQPTHIHLDMVYVITLPHQTGKNNRQESHSLGWFTADEIESLKTLPNVRLLAKEILFNKISR